MKKLLLIFMSYALLIINTKITAEINTEETTNPEISITTSINVLGKSEFHRNKEYNKNTQIISKDFINQNSPRSIYETLESNSVIMVNSDIPGSIDIRGQGEERNRRNVQILIDDVPLNSLDSTSYLFKGYNIFPMQQLSAIEIIPGGGSVIYGNGVQGGVINLHTGFLFNQKPIKSVYLGYASFNSIKSGVTLGHTFFDNKLSLQLNYSGERSKAYLRGERHNSDYLAASTRFALTNNQRISYAFSTYKSNGLYSNALEETKIEEDWRASSPLDTKKMKKDDHKVLYQAEFEKVSIDNLTFFSERDMNFVSFGREAMTNEKIQGNKLKVKYYYDTNKKNSILLGSDLIEQKLDVIGTKYNKTTLAAFALNKVYFFDKIYTTQGYRFNRDNWVRHSKDKNRIDQRTQQMISTATSNPTVMAIINQNPKVLDYVNQIHLPQKDITIKDTFNKQALELSLGYDYSTKGSTWVRLEKGFTAPNTRNLIDNVGGINTSNNLKYEDFITYEVGLEDMLTSSTYIRIAGFYTHTKNEIEAINIKGLALHSILPSNIPPHVKNRIPNISFGSSRYNFNLGETVRKGIEFNIDQSLFSVFNIFVGGTYVDAKIKKINTKTFAHLDQKEKEVAEKSLEGKEGKKLAKVSPLKLHTGFKYQILDSLVFTTTINYVSAHLPYFNKPDVKLGERVLTNVVLRYNNNNLNIGVGVNNLFDKRYYVGIGDPYIMMYSPKDVVRQGMERNFFVEAQYTF